MLYNRFLIFVLASFVASIVSVVLILVIGKMPVPMEGNDSNSINEYLFEGNKGRIFLEEEVEEGARAARSEIKKKISAAKERESSMDFYELLKPVKQRAIYVAWLPWLILPFLVSIKQRAWVFSLLLVPLMLVFAGFFSVVEVLIFGISISIGLWMSNKLGVKPRWPK